MLRSLLLCPISLAVAASMAAQGVPRFEPLERGACDACIIALQQVATVGRADDAELIDDYGTLHAVPGGFVVQNIMAKTPLLHYDSSGRYLGFLGRLGGGPGEYPQYVQAIISGPGDSTTIIGPGHLAVISVTTGRGRSGPLPVAITGFNGAVLANRSLMLNLNEDGNPAFALLDPAGHLVRTFGDTQPMVVLPHQHGRAIRDVNATVYFVTASRDGGAWIAARYYRHHMEHLSRQGTAVTSSTRRPAWFPPYAYADIDENLYRLGESRAPRPTQAVGMARDGAGNVMVLYRAADAHWKPDPNAPPPPRPGIEYPADKRVPTGGVDRYVDGILEVYDDTTGRFLGSWRSDVAPTGLLPNGLIYTRNQDADGIISYWVYRVKVTGR